MNLLGRKGKAREKWRTRARMIDMQRTKVILSPPRKQKQIPTWVYRKLIRKD